MNYVIATSRKQRKRYLAFRKGKDGSVPVPVEHHGPATDVAMLEHLKLNPLCSEGTKITLASDEGKVA